MTCAQRFVTMINKAERSLGTDFSTTLRLQPDESARIRDGFISLIVRKPSDGHRSESSYIISSTASMPHTFGFSCSATIADIQASDSVDANNSTTRHRPKGAPAPLAKTLLVLLLLVFLTGCAATRINYKVLDNVPKGSSELTVWTIAGPPSSAAKRTVDGVKWTRWQYHEDIGTWALRAMGSGVAQSIADAISGREHDKSASDQFFWFLFRDGTLAEKWHGKDEDPVYQPPLFGDRTIPDDRWRSIKLRLREVSQPRSPKDNPVGASNNPASP